MARTVCEWRCGYPPYGIRQIFLVDLRGGFGGAFAAAMMEAVGRPGAPVTFELRLKGGGTIQEPAERYLHPSLKQQKAIRQHLGGRKRVKLLDLGCGVGRHLRFVRQECAQADLWATEKDPTLRAYCRFVCPAKVFAAWEETGERDFDIILMLGNGLGLFGDEAGVLAGLRRAFESLAPGGVLIGEGMPRHNRSCAGVEHRIYYELPCNPSWPQTDPWFRWAYCSDQWLISKLTEIGFTEVRIIQLLDIPGAYLFVAEKPHGPPKARKRGTPSK